MSKRLNVLIIVLFSILIIPFLVFSPTIFQEGNPLPVMSGIMKLSMTGEGYAKINEHKYIVRANEKDIKKLEDYLAQNNLVHAEQMGSAHLFKDKNGKTYTAISRMYTTSFEIWDFSNSVNQGSKQKREFIAPAGVSIEIPEGMTFKQETAEDIQRTSFSIKNNSSSFEMHGVYEGENVSMDFLERAKGEMEPDSIKEVAVDGYKGIKGLVTGIKTRYVVLLINDHKTLTLSVVPPTQENIDTFDQILSSMRFR